MKANKENLGLISLLFWGLALILADRLNAQESQNYAVKRQIVDGLKKCPKGYGNTCYKKVVEHQIRWETIGQDLNFKPIDVPTTTPIKEKTIVGDYRTALRRRYGK